MPFCRRGSDLGAALLRAPFVDLVSTALNPDAPLVAHEASEWGDAAGDASALDAVSHS
jgi:protease II